MVSVDFVGVRWGGIGQIAKSGVGTPPSDPHKIRTDDMVEVDLGGAHRGYKIRFSTIDDTVGDDNGATAVSDDDERLWSINNGCDQ